MTNALYSLDDGRAIVRGGAILATVKVGDLTPAETDDFGRKIVAALNAYNPETAAPENVWTLAPELRKAAILSALDLVLRGLPRPVDTKDVIQALENIVGPDKRLPRVIVDLAASTPEAHQSAETFKRYGREMRRWVWSPRT